MRFWQTIRAGFQQVGLSRQAYPVWATMTWRGALLGTALLLALADDRYRNLRYSLVAYTIALVWSYYDGVFARRRWSIAGLEGVLLYLLAITFGNFLSLTLGYR